MTVRISHDVGVADWVVTRIFQPGHGTAPHLVPDVFDAYVRIFHPVVGSTKGGRPEPLIVRWSDIADRVGVRLIPTTGWAGLANPAYRDAGERAAELSQRDWQEIVNAAYSDDDIQGAQPATGLLEEPQCQSLARILAQFTATPEACWFALWPGYGMLPSFDGVPVALAPPHDPIREYVLFQGPVDAVGEFWFEDGLWYQSPTMWWPTDRAWFVHTEVDDTSTFVGGNADCIRAIMSSAYLEAMQIDAEHNIGL